MAIGINSIFECRSGATAANVNGALFNPERTAELTDLIATSSSGQSATPTVSSATYTFAATDDEAWLFIQSGGTFRPGWYRISSVSGGVATLDAAVGNGVLYTSGVKRELSASTAQGIASTDSPTGGSFMIDYSQQNGPILDLGDVTSTASTTITSVTGGFTKAMVGNGAHLNSATGADEVVGFHEITSVTDTNTAILDKTTGTYTVGDLNVGGAASLQSSVGATDDSLFETLLGTNGSGSMQMFIKSGTYNSMGAISTTAIGGTLAPIQIWGYNSLRTDGLTSTNLGSNRPTLNFAANGMIFGANWEMKNVIMTTTSAGGLTTSTANKIIFCKITNSSTTAARIALTIGNHNTLNFGNELVSYRGRAISETNIIGTRIIGNYLHNSDVGWYVSTPQAGRTFMHNIVSAMQTYAIQYAAAQTSQIIIANNTFNGTSPSATPKQGTGYLILTGSLQQYLYNNTFTGFTLAVDHADDQTVCFDAFNNYYGNTTDVDDWQKGMGAIAVDPSFSNLTTVSGSTATTSTSGGNKIIDTNATFQTSGIVAGDIIHITGGTAGPVLCAYSISSVDSETQVTVGETIVANATADHTWFINKGNNFAVGTNLKATAFPGVFPGALTTGYMDIGAVQREEPAAGGGTSTPISFW